MNYKYTIAYNCENSQIGNQLGAHTLNQAKEVGEALFSSYVENKVKVDYIHVIDNECEQVCYVVYQENCQVNTVVLNDRMSRLIFSIIEYKVRSGEEVNHTGFGKFFLKDGEIAFKSGWKLKDALNPEPEERVKTIDRTARWREFMQNARDMYKNSQ